MLAEGTYSGTAFRGAHAVFRVIGREWCSVQEGHGLFRDVSFLGCVWEGGRGGRVVFTMTIVSEVFF